MFIWFLNCRKSLSTSFCWVALQPYLDQPNCSLWSRWSMTKFVRTGKSMEDVTVTWSLSIKLGTSRFGTPKGTRTRKSWELWWTSWWLGLGFEQKSIIQWNFRRLKKDVLDDLPEKRRELVFLQGAAIDNELKRLEVELAKAKGNFVEGMKGKKKVWALIMTTIYYTVL